jgi:hypothetical protein
MSKKQLIQRNGNCHNPIFEQIIQKLNIVDNGVKTTKFEVWGCNMRVN